MPVRAPACARSGAFGLRLSAAIVLLLVIAALVAGVILVGARLFQPSPLASGRLGHLAYGLDGDIFVADWDGGNPVRIADGPPGGKSGCGPAGYRSPIWSPNGRYLAYRSGLDQVSCPSIGTVNISDPDGHVMASFPGVGDALSWSPDSTRLATWLDWGNRTIGVYGLDGTREALLTLPAGFWTWRDEDAHWSPDGELLLISLRPDPGQTPARPGSCRSMVGRHTRCQPATRGPIGTPPSRPMELTLLMSMRGRSWSPRAMVPAQQRWLAKRSSRESHHSGPSHGRELLIASPSLLRRADKPTTDR